MPAVYLDQMPADLAQQRHARRLVVDEDAAAPVGRLRAPQDQVALFVEAVVAHDVAGEMVGGKVEDGRDAALRSTMAHQRGVAARAQRQRQRVEQDRLARAGLAGQHRQAGGKIDVEPFDQNDIADRQVGEHQSMIPKRGSRFSLARTFGSEKITPRKKDEAGKRSADKSSRPGAGQLPVPPSSRPAALSHEPVFSRGVSPPDCKRA